MKEKFKILYYYPYLHFDTGSPKAMISFIDGLDRKMFEPVVLAAGWGLLVQALSARGVRIIRGKAAKVSYRRPVEAVVSIRRQEVQLREEGIDLVHVMEFGWNLDLVLAAWLRRIPVVLHVNVPSAADIQNLHRFAADKVLFCSEFERGNFQHLERLGRKSEVLYNCTDVSAMAGGTSIRKKLALEPEDIVIGTIAQIKSRKGIDIVMETARLLLPRWKQLAFLVIGGPDSTDPEFTHRMQKLAEDSIFCGRVKFLGSRADIPDLLASMDLLFHPTRAEPFGIVIIEGMAAGLPVVASNLGGIPEIISSPALGCLVSPIEAQAFARAISTILQLPDRGRAMGQRGQESIVGRFDGAAIQQKLQGIYFDLLPGEHRRPLI